MGMTEDGILGEKLLFSLFWERGYDKGEYFQADAVGRKNNEGRDFIFEAKYQERYTAVYKGRKTGPFDGHGLPPGQVKARIEFEERTGIASVFVVFDKETGEIFWNLLSELEKGKHFDTRGTRNGPRRIYPIDNFKKENTLVEDLRKKYPNQFAGV